MCKISIPHFLFFYLKTLVYGDEIWKIIRRDNKVCYFIGAAIINLTVDYRVTSYTWQCISCTLCKVTCPLYASSVAYTEQVIFYEVLEVHGYVSLVGLYIFLTFRLLFKKNCMKSSYIKLLNVYTAYVLLANTHTDIHIGLRPYSLVTLVI